MQFEKMIKKYWQELLNTMAHEKVSMIQNEIISNNTNSNSLQSNLLV